jgi:hypothetical protein
MSNNINLHEIMCTYAAENFKNTNNLFKLQFLMHPTNVLCKISVVYYSYRSVNEMTF